MAVRGTKSDWSQFGFSHKDISWGNHQSIKRIRQISKANKGNFDKSWRVIINEKNFWIKNSYESQSAETIER
jgi:hypothetical protein